MTAAETARFEVLLEDIQRGVRVIAESQVALTARLDHIETQFGARFDVLEIRFGALEARFAAMEHRFAGMETRVTAVESRLEDLATDTQSRLQRIDDHLHINGRSKSLHGQPSRPAKKPRTR